LGTVVPPSVASAAKQFAAIENPPDGAETLGMLSGWKPQAAPGSTECQKGFELARFCGIAQKL
jgi:hypothetical protein